MFSILGLILSLIIIMYLAYKGYSTIITAPIIAIITIILTTGFNGHLMANYTEVYMSGFANFIKNYFPLFMTGAISVSYTHLFLINIFSIYFAKYSILLFTSI